ncbi:DNA mismatch repair endonuclease MutL [Halobacteriales archaeon Cl-PHB]
MPEDSAITQLDAQTVERIAAGEVVERPASVVKELVENAIDADADRVDVTVHEGGTEGIRVSDDGRGMTREAVQRAVEKHTTSKISDIGDLESGVATLGFRGEALHAIGAVSRLTVRTRPRSDRQVQSDAGTELVVEGGDVTEVGPAGCPEGTTVEVADLFYNVPARRKYLKQAATEFAHVNTVVTSYALANPDVAVSLTHGDRETFATTGGGDRRETVMAVYGREVAQSMIPVEPNELPEGPLEGVSGLVSHPETNRASRDYLSTFVNGRFVTASTVREAIVEAYDTQLAPDRYPFAVLDLAVDAGTVDVNVHPRKLEVRFADEEGVRNQIEAAVSAALMREGLIRSAAPRGQSAPDEAEIRPGDDGSEATPVADAAGSESDDGPSDPPTRPGPTVDAESVRAGRVGGDATRSPTSETADATGTDDATTTDAAAGDADRGPGTGSVAQGSATDPDRKFRGGTDQATLGDASGGGRTTDEAAAEARNFDSLPAMRVLGQLHDTYVVAETADGLVLIDQHAADERINYERLRAELQGDTPTQALADPVNLELTAGEAALFEERVEALAALGFQAERVDDRTVRVATVPALVAEAADPGLLRDVLGALVEGDGDAAATVEAAADDLLADLACYPSITGNTSLTEGSVLDLLERLDDCDNPYACPHGRPVVIELARDELEARFERDYPGHGG